MKKLFIIMTLFMSSFFLLSLKKVKAYELEVNLDFSYIPEDLSTMINAVENFISTDETYSDNYMIYRSTTSVRYCVVIMPLDYSSQPHINVFSSYIQILFNSSSSFSKFDFSSDFLNLIQNGTMVNKYNNVYAFNSATLYIPIYSNFDILMKKDTSLSTITYKYNDFTSTNTADGVDKFKTLYALYQEYQNSINTEDPVHKEELIKVENFYKVIIEKLSYLAETIVSNYIYLSIIAIFMLIFVFKLIFRRFL